MLIETARQRRLSGAEISDEMRTTLRPLAGIAQLTTTICAHLSRDDKLAAHSTFVHPARKQLSGQAFPIIK